MKKGINLYANNDIISKIREKFGYVFESLVPEANGFYYKPCLIPNEISGLFKIKDLEIMSFEQNHGFTNSTGFRIKNFAYCTDVFDFDDNALGNLKNLDLWIVDCLRFEPHKCHAHYEKVMQWVGDLKPKKTVFTHMNYDIDYDYIKSIAPRNCMPAYDGLILKV